MPIRAGQMRAKAARRARLAMVARKRASAIPAIVAGFGLSLLAPGRLAGPAAFVLGLALVWRSPGPLRALVHAAAAAGLSCRIFDTLVSQPWPDPWMLRLLR